MSAQQENLKQDQIVKVTKGFDILQIKSDTSGTVNGVLGHHVLSFE